MPTGKWDKEWNNNIRELGLKWGAKMQHGDPFKGLLMSGSTSKGTDATRERAVRSDSFGYEPNEWEICLQLVDLRKGGKTYGQIADWLNKKNIKTKYGNSWNYFTARFVTLRTVQILRQREIDSESLANGEKQ